MPRKKKTIGQLLAELRWNKATDQERKDVGAMLTHARKSKRSNNTPKLPAEKHE